MVVLALLFAQGFSTRLVGATGEQDTAGGRAPLGALPALLAARHGRLVGIERPVGRRVALTFDDGPDPRWTPRIAAVLRRLRVPATFFEVGSQVARHPGLVRDLYRDGFEVGDHTFTHVDLSTVPGWQRSLQVELASTAVAGAAGARPRVLRPPYSSTSRAVTVGQARALRALARQGYVIALTNFDSQDWRRPGIAAITRNATPTGRRGGIVLMHDGGGDRAQTVAALPGLVARLRRRGYRFVTVSALAGLPRAEVDLPVTPWQQIKGWLLLSALAVARWLTQAIFAVLIASLGLLGARFAVALMLARRHARAARTRRVDPAFAPPVSVIVPAYNEALVIERAVRSLAQSDYPCFEVIVIDDGSSDQTAALVQRLDLDGVRVTRQPNAGKPAALNRGIDAARHQIIAMVDADTIFELDTLRRLVQPFLAADVGAVSGNTKVGNRGGLLGRWQHIEYVIGFNLDRRLYDVLRCMPTVPGAIGAFRRQALADIGGVSGATLAEDTDITLAAGRAGWRVVYVEDARAWTEAPASLTALWRQRYRWSYGTMQAVWKHKSAIWRPRERRVGWLAIPYLTVFQIALPLLAPVIDLVALYGLVFLAPLPVLGYWLGFNLIQAALGYYAFRLDHESPRPLWAMPLQQFVYRQLMYLVVIQSVISALQGTRLRWHHMHRTGEVQPVVQEIAE